MRRSDSRRLRCCGAPGVVLAPGWHQEEVKGVRVGGDVGTRIAASEVDAPEALSRARVVSSASSMDAVREERPVGDRGSCERLTAERAGLIALLATLCAEFAGLQLRHPKAYSLSRQSPDWKHNRTWAKKRHSRQKRELGRPFLRRVFSQVDLENAVMPLLSCGDLGWVSPRWSASDPEAGVLGQSLQDEALTRG